MRELFLTDMALKFRMKLAGDVSLGPDYSGDYEDVHLSQASPELLIYNTLSAGPATLFGAYPRHGGYQGGNDAERSGDDDNDSDRSGGSPALPNNNNPFPPPEGGSSSAYHQALFFSAPLDNVTRLQVLGDPGTGCCHAILLDYANGSRRALGNCRLGVDPVIETYPHPARLCCRAVPPAENADEAAARAIPGRSLRGAMAAGRKMTQVEGGPEPAGSAHRHHHSFSGGGDDDDDDGVLENDGMETHHDEEDGWVCSGLQGNTMKMWFSAEKSVIRITPAATLPTG